MAEDKGDVPNTPETADAGDCAEAAPIEQTDSPTAFLTSLSEMLKGVDGVDVDLAGILIDHVLVVAPHNNAIASAKAAIVDLARERAMPTTGQGPDVANG